MHLQITQMMLLKYIYRPVKKQPQEEDLIILFLCAFECVVTPVHMYTDDAVEVHPFTGL